MEKLYKRHRAMAVAAGHMLSIARSWSHSLNAADPEVAIYWWHDEDGVESLSDNSEMGLRTAVDIAGLQPVLYGYRRPLNLQVGVEFKDASDLLPLEEFTKLRRKYKHAVIADLARLRGMKKAVDGGRHVRLVCRSRHDLVHGRQNGLQPVTSSSVRARRRDDARAARVAGGGDENN